MFKSFSIFSIMFFIGLAFANGQAFDKLNSLVKEREALQASYDKINVQVKTSKSKKPSAELQSALEKLMAKDNELINEIAVVQSAVSRQQAEVSSKKEEKIKPAAGRIVNKAQTLLIDSLYNVLAITQSQKDSLLAGTISFNTFQESLQNELKYATDEKAQIQKELDNVKTDKFILARRNHILLYFNMGVGVLLLSALIYVILSFRKKKIKIPVVSVQDLTPSKPRPITGFNQAIPKIAFEAFDTRVDKIEKLGKLREKGLLTEEEFLMQKQQILNSRINER